MTVIIRDYAGIRGYDKKVNVTAQRMINLYLDYGQAELAKMGITLLDNDAAQGGEEVEG